LLAPSFLMVGLGVYWLSTVKMLDGKRAEFLESQRTRDYQQSIDGLLNGRTQASKEQYLETLKKQQAMVKWERGYYEALRSNMVGLSWVAAFIGLCQVVGVYYVHKRLRGLRT